MYATTTTPSRATSSAAGNNSSWMSTSRRSTRSARGSAKSRGRRVGFGNSKEDANRAAAASRIKKITGPARKWVQVMRPPAPRIRFLVATWVSMAELTESERHDYETAKIQKQQQEQQQQLAEAEEQNREEATAETGTSNEQPPSDANNDPMGMDTASETAAPRITDTYTLGGLSTATTEKEPVDDNSQDDPPTFENNDALPSNTTTTTNSEDEEPPRKKVRLEDPTTTTTTTPTDGVASTTRPNHDQSKEEEDATIKRTRPDEETAATTQDEPAAKRVRIETGHEEPTETDTTPDAVTIANEPPTSDVSTKEKEEADVESKPASKNNGSLPTSTSTDDAQPEAEAKETTAEQPSSQITDNDSKSVPETSSSSL